MFKSKKTGLDLRLVIGVFVGAMAMLCVGWDQPADIGRADNSAFTVNSSRGVPQLFLVDTTGTNTFATNNKAGIARMSTNRMQYMQIGDGGGSNQFARVSAEGKLLVEATVAADAASAREVTLTNFFTAFRDWTNRAPASLGQKTMAASFPVVIASDQGGLTIQDGGGSITIDGSVALLAGTNSIGRVVCDYGSGTFIVGDGSGPLTVDGTVASTQSGTWTVDLGSLNGAATAANQVSQTNLATQANTILIGVTNRLNSIEGLLTTIDSDTSVLAATDFMLGTDFSAVYGTGSLLTTTQADDLANTLDGAQSTAFTYVFDGTTWDRLRGNSTDGVLVNLGANNDVTVAGMSTEAKQDTIIGHLDGVEGFIDGIEALIGTSNTNTQDLDANTDGIEGQLTSIQAALDFQTNGVLMASGVTANGAVYSNLVKSSAAKVYSINVGNTNGNQVLYGKVFNQASAVAVGGITPVYTFIVPGATNGAGNNVVFPNGGLALSSGFYLAITGGPATNDTTAVTGVQVWGATYR